MFISLIKVMCKVICRLYGYNMFLFILKLGTGKNLMFLAALLSFDIRTNTVRIIGSVSLPEKYTTVRISVYDIPCKNGGLTYHFKRRIVPQRITITSFQTPLWGQLKTSYRKPILRDTFF